MILEGLVTTTMPDGAMHLAPMGPRLLGDSKNFQQFLLRPFPSSQTYRNLKAKGEGVLHVTDDVLLLAQAAVGKAPEQPTRTATSISGFILTHACRYFEFVVDSWDESQERMQIVCSIVATGNLRDFFGLNRGKHAVVEAAILATRLHLLAPEEVRADYRKLQVLVEKTGGPAEHEAFAFLQHYVENNWGKA